MKRENNCFKDAHKFSGTIFRSKYKISHANNGRDVNSNNFSSKIRSKLVKRENNCFKDAHKFSGANIKLVMPTMATMLIQKIFQANLEVNKSKGEQTR